MPSGPIPELLAPAGDADALRAALAAGADAVYFGLDLGFNARARTGNFSLETLPDTVASIHTAGARAYLTLNTLIFEQELPVVESILRAVADAGVDALIVQDPAVAMLARALAPSLEVHASTQMTISSPEAAAFAETLGCTRVVVPRELSVAEIRQFAAGTPLELEVFIHGALCMSWSGQCLTSEAWGGRSANRGQCAQSCRMPYDLVVDDVVRPLGDVQYLLSPLDLAGLDVVAELADIGVHGLKIEGRQKSPQYVATAVKAYRQQLNGIAGLPTPTRLENSAAQMALSYSRGFSQGFLGGTDHQTLVEGRFPKHRGLLMGEVVAVTRNSVQVQKQDRVATGGLALGLQSNAKPETPEMADLAPRAGMGVGFERGRPESDEPGGPLFAVDALADGWLLRFGQPGPDLARVQVGDRAWLTGDPKLANETADVLRQTPTGRIPVDIVVSGRVGEPLTVRLTALGPIGMHATVTGQTELPLQQAASGGLDESVLRDKLAALGGTPFCLHDMDLRELQPGMHVAVSALKALRRALVERLWPEVEAKHRHPVNPQPQALALVEAAVSRRQITTWQPTAAPQLLALCRNDAQLDAVIAAGLPEVELDWMELVGLTRAVDKARAAGLRVTIATVRVQKPGEDGYDRRIARLKPDGVLVRHWGGLMQFARGDADDRPAVHGDFSLNVTNSLTAHHLLALGADTLTVAHDLDEAQLLALLTRVPAERLTVTVHHHIATFHTEHCVYAHLLSQGADFRTCGRPCEQHTVSLRDHVGHSHPVIVDVGCRNTVFNAQAQSAASVAPTLLTRGVRRFRVEFVRETQAEAQAVLVAWQGLLAGTLLPAELLEKIAVHEQFGVTAGTMRAMGGPL
jgi:putative protease